MHRVDDQGTYGKCIVDIYRGEWIKNTNDMTFSVNPADEHIPYVRLTVIHAVYRKPVAGENMLYMEVTYA